MPRGTAVAHICFSGRLLWRGALAVSASGVNCLIDREERDRAVTSRVGSSDGNDFENESIQVQGHDDQSISSDESLEEPLPSTSQTVSSEPSTRTKRGRENFIMPKHDPWRRHMLAVCPMRAYRGARAGRAAGMPTHYPLHITWSSSYCTLHAHMLSCISPKTL
ncbi:hypothetical protein EVAR_34338_1 [Eumeta japonica]|uniref:Uncharacterized protein n=1 Tax=Eumeta variegata TaxID=151549 RepID=A0A4C1VFX0_EUMVA|nr:hypothetical protein EVAR_34338_1 [Eumeta japonica]